MRVHGMGELSKTMQRVAFLRAINVGKRTIRKEALVSLFEELGFAHARTVIASGNVIFQAGREADATLARRIEAGVRQAFGFEADTFVRSLAELARINAWRPPGCEALPAGHNLLVGFLAQPLTPAQVALLPSLQTSHDALFAHGAELWWWARGRQSDTLLGPGQPEKALKLRTTFRKVETLERVLAAA
jgi:uncharacterized protein (DUF1697 family)